MQQKVKTNIVLDAPLCIKLDAVVHQANVVLDATLRSHPWRYCVYRVPYNMHTLYTILVTINASSILIRGSTALLLYSHSLKINHHQHLHSHFDGNFQSNSAEEDVADVSFLSYTTPQLYKIWNCSLCNYACNVSQRVYVCTHTAMTQSMFTGPAGAVKAGKVK